jgi:type I restriction enzyme R subunit
VDMYNALIKLRPDWASSQGDDPDAEKGGGCVVKVVMTGSADDGPDWQPHIRSKDKRRKLANRFKDAKDTLRTVIVRNVAERVRRPLPAHPHMPTSRCRATA